MVPSFRGTISSGWKSTCEPLPVEDQSLKESLIVELLVLDLVESLVDVLLDAATVGDMESGTLRWSLLSLVDIGEGGKDVASSASVSSSSWSEFRWRCEAASILALASAAWAAASRAPCPLLAALNPTADPIAAISLEAEG